MKKSLFKYYISINISENGPKNVRLFINQTRTLDFDGASSNQSIQDLE